MLWGCGGGQSKSGPPVCAHSCDRDATRNAETVEVKQALGQNPTSVYFQFGEQNGAQDGNRDRVYISTNGVGSNGVDAHRFRSFMSGNGVMTSTNVGDNHDQSISVG
eukprot:UN21923